MVYPRSCRRLQRRLPQVGGKGMHILTRAPAWRHHRIPPAFREHPAQTGLRQGVRIGGDTLGVFYQGGGARFQALQGSEQGHNGELFGGEQAVRRHGEM